MSDPVFEQVDEEIFDGDNMAQAVAIIWWLVHLAGGKVVFPIDEDFYLDYYPRDTRLVLRKEADQLVLVAEQKQWTVSQL
jgi:hypothetical protein